MKKIITLLLAVSILNGNILAQKNQDTGKRQEIRQKQKEFIINKLQLTEKEKKEFIPLYDKYGNEKEKLMIEKHKAMKFFKKNHLNMTNEQLLSLSDKLVNIDLETARLSKQYNDKFKKVLPPLKIILLYQAENEFKKQLIKKMHKKGQKMPPK